MRGRSAESLALQVVHAWRKASRQVSCTRTNSPAHQLTNSPTPYCTFAVTDAAAFSVNVQLLALFPPLEHAPDQIASRPFETLSVVVVPVANDADPVLPTETLMPAGVDVMLSPLRPVAVTVSVSV